MRFSTNPVDVLHDKVSVPRGLALKVFDVPGERLPGSEADVTQNFVFADSPAFSAPTAKKFLANLKPLAASTDVAEGAKKALSATLRVAERVVEAFGGQSSTLISMGGHPMTHVLGASFYSGAALRHGRHVAKYAVVPVSMKLKSLTGQEVDLDDRPDGLREEVVAFARITAEPQVGWSDAIQRATEDGMFFSPWRDLAAHQPLGNAMRARKAACEQSARLRAERNGTPVVEPTDLSAFPV